MPEYENASSFVERTEPSFNRSEDQMSSLSRNCWNDVATGSGGGSGDNLSRAVTSAIQTLDLDASSIYPSEHLSQTRTKAEELVNSLTRSTGTESSSCEQGNSDQISAHGTDKQQRRPADAGADAGTDAGREPASSVRIQERIDPVNHNRIRDFDYGNGRSATAVESEDHRTRQLVEREPGRITSTNWSPNGSVTQESISSDGSRRTTVWNPADNSCSETTSRFDRLGLPHVDTNVTRGAQRPPQPQFVREDGTIPRSRR